MNTHRTHLGRAGQGGFTLIEVMVVIVILGIMAALVVPNVVGRQDQAQVAAARLDISTLGNALEMYRSDNNNYPSTEQGLQALVEKPTGFPEPRNWNERYLQKRAIPDDPWGNPYQYLASGRSFELFSYGADGQEGGEGPDADIRFGDI